MTLYEQAVQAVYEKYAPLFYAAGLIPVPDISPEQAYTLLDECQVLRDFWTEYQAQQISQDCSDSFDRFRRYEEQGAGHCFEAQKALLRAMRLAPPWMKAHFDDCLKDLLPEAAGYLEDGTPVYSVEDIARKQGLSEDEAQESFSALLAAHEQEGIPLDGVITDSWLVHTKQ